MAIQLEPQPTPDGRMGPSAEWYVGNYHLTWTSLDIVVCSRRPSHGYGDGRRQYASRSWSSEVSEDVKCVRLYLLTLMSNLPGSFTGTRPERLVHYLLRTDFH